MERLKMNRAFGPVWVIAEQADGEVEVVSLQILGKAGELADELGTACEAVLLGHNLKESARKLIEAGADRVLLADDPALEFYQPEIYREIVCSLALEHSPEIILTGSTFMGRELAPLVAACLRTALAAHCIGLKLDKGQKPGAAGPRIWRSAVDNMSGKASADGNGRKGRF